MVPYIQICSVLKFIKERHKLQSVLHFFQVVLNIFHKIILKKVYKIQLSFPDLHR